MRHVEDSLWSRWQQRRSERAFEQLVQPHLRFLRGFARRLGCTSADADDVVQKTLVRLAGDRTRKPAEVGLRAWLGRTVLSEAKMAFRARKRRRRHERRAPVHLPPGLDAVDERDEVEVALRGLREGERRAIVLRFLHDLDYDEVAHILGTTRRAARLRVHRGLARLRKRLGPRALACLAALPLLGGRAAARQQSVRAALHEAATASGATSVSTLAGAFVMTTTAKLSLGVCAALVASLLVWQAASRPRDSVKRAGRGSATNSREQQQQPVESAPAVSEPPASSTGRDHARTFPDKPIPPGKGCVIGRVVVSDGAPLKRTKLALWGTPQILAETDDEGRFHIHGDWVAQRDIVIVGPREYAFTIGSVRMKPDERIRVDLEIERGAELEGVLRGEGGDTLAGVPVTLRRPGANTSNVLQGGFGMVKTDERGRFRFQYLPDGRYTLQLTARGFEPRLHLFQVESRDVRLDLQLKAARPLVIRFENLAEAAQGMEVSWAIQGRAPPGFSFGDRRVIDGKAELVVEAPPPGRFHLILFRTTYTPRIERDLEITTKPPAPVVVRLSKGGPVEGILRDARGRVLAGLRVVVSGGRAKRTDAKGRFVLEWVPEGGHDVWLLDDGARVLLGRFEFPTTFLDLKAPGSSSLELKLPGNADPHNGIASLFDGSRKLAEGRPDTYGRIHFRRLAAGMRKLTLSASGYAFESRWIEIHPEQQIDLGQMDLRKLIEVPVLVSGAGTLRFLWARATLRSTGPAGQISLTQQSGWITIDENGRGRLKGLPAGSFTVTIGGQGRQPTEIQLTLREGQIDPLRISLPER